jgi:hypothetical protein
MVVLERLLELNPTDFVCSRLHRFEMFPPHQCFTPKLQGRKVFLVLLRARKGKSRKFGLYSPDPSSASSGSSGLVNVGGFIPINWL